MRAKARPYTVEAARGEMQKALAGLERERRRLQAVARKLKAARFDPRSLGAWLTGASGNGGTVLLDLADTIKGLRYDLSETPETVATYHAAMDADEQGILASRPEPARAARP